MKTLLKALCIALVYIICTCAISIVFRHMEVQRDISCDCIVDCCCELASEECVAATITRPPCVSATVEVTQTPKSTPTVYNADTPTPRHTRQATPTHTPPPPTKTPTVPVTCYQWVCHQTGNAGEKDYCCDSDGCVDAHLGHGDYLGKCR